MINLFSRSKKIQVKQSFNWSLVGEQIAVQLQQEQAIAISAWVKQAEVSNLAAISLLLGELQDFTLNLIVQDEYTILLSPQWVANLTQFQAQSLNLPPANNFILDIDHVGTLDQVHFKFDYRWLRPNGQAVLGVKRDGALIKIANQYYRLNQTHYALVQGIDKFNRTPPQDLEARFLAWGELSDFLPEATAQAIRTHGYLRNTKVVHATAFSLDINTNENEINFKPVLIRTTKSDNLTATQNLLNPDQQQIFAHRFSQAKQAKSRYVLQDGCYVVLDAALQQALAVVHQQQHASANAKREFVKNPRSYLRRALENDFAEQILENVFIETSDYSQRVSEIGLWEQKIIPWVQKQAETWLPEANSGSAIFGASDNLTTHKITLNIADNLTNLHYTKELNPRPVNQLKLPNFIKTSLKEHQIYGVNWLQQHWCIGSAGALLADDMGLGKTLQALSFLAWLKQAMRDNEIKNAPILIVAPTGLLSNWQQEHERHIDAPGLGKLQLAFGSKLKTLRAEPGQELEQGIPLLKREQLQQADWILTTYETLRDYQHSFGSVQYAIIVFDEVQKIKTPATLMTEAAKAMQAEFVLAMTGTPIENRLADLWCIIDTVWPGYLGDLKEFSQFYEKDLASLKLLKPRLTEAQDNIPAIMLRRMKEEHLTSLPDKQLHLLPNTIQPTMPKLQEQSYTAIVQGQNKTSMLDTLQQLRMISLHPLLDNQIVSIDDNYIQQSARLIKTFNLLDEIYQKQEKVLIFLESQLMQTYLMVLIERLYDIQPMLINGSVTGDKRQQRVNQFQNKIGFDVFIISPLAGGVGLTLTAANHVIHLSRWWNPAVEDQCTDRAYRLGQEKTVHVYYPLAIHPKYQEHSFDVRLHLLLERKRQLSREMLLPPNLTTEDMELLYEYSTNS